MNRMLSKFGISLALCFTASLSIAQNIPSFKPIQNIIVGKTTLSFIGNRIFAKKTDKGWTLYVFDNVRLVKETGPGGVIGTYMYGAEGRLEHIVYSNGRSISVTYAPSGEIKDVSSSTAWRAVFHPRPANAKLAPVASSIATGSVPVAAPVPLAATRKFQTIISPMDMICMEGGPPCIIDVWPGDDSNEGRDGGNPYFGRDDGGDFHNYNDNGEGGGDGSSGTVFETPEECKAKVCDGGWATMTAYCAVAAKGPDNNRRCNDKAFEFYSKCLRSCDNGDWSWMDLFNHVW